MSELWQDVGVDVGPGEAGEARMQEVSSCEWDERQLNEEALDHRRRAALCHRGPGHVCLDP